MGGLNYDQRAALTQFVRRGCVPQCNGEHWCPVCDEQVDALAAVIDGYMAGAATAALTEAADDLHEAAQAITNTDASSRARKAALAQAVRTLRSRIQPP